MWSQWDEANLGLASMKQGSHIMLQRLVRSMVRIEPRPCVTVDVP